MYIIAAMSPYLDSSATMNNECLGLVQAANVEPLGHATSFLYPQIQVNRLISLLYTDKKPPVHLSKFYEIMLTFMNVYWHFQISKSNHL